MEKKEVKNKSIYLKVLVAGLILIQVIFVCVENHVEQEEIVNNIDTTACDRFTINDWLVLQQGYIEEAHIDSVFRTMPKLVLMHIVTINGTDLSIKDVVNAYEENKEMYDSMGRDENTNKE